MDEWDDLEPDDFQKKNYKDLPVFQHGRDLLETVYAVYQLMKVSDEGNTEEEADPEKQMLREVIQIMLEDAQIALAKIAGAEGGDIYGIRLENAYIIKSHARNLQVSCNNLEMFSDVDPEYIQLIRQKTDAFRVAFLEWVASFDPNNDVRDEWDFH